MRFKKVLASVMLIMVICISQAYAVATTGECGDSATYSLEHNILTISGTGIVDNDDGWIDYYNVIDTLIISEGIEELDRLIFDGFEVLSSVTLPDSLTTIGTRTFRDCISLSNLVIPDSVVDIASNSFSGCDNLTIICSSGSYAEEYAIANSIAYKIISNITISFDSNGGTMAPKALTGSIIEEFIMPVQKPTRENYIFVGWADSNTATEAIFQPSDKANFTEDTTLYAVWMQCEFLDASTENNIVINSNVTSPDLNLFVAAYGEENRLLDVIIKPVKLNPGENIFATEVNWSDLDRFLVKAFLWDENLMPYTECKSVKLTQNHKVVFEDWDGTVISTQIITTGNNAILPDSPSREGYEFCGWNGVYTNIVNDSKIIAQYIDSSKDNVFKVFNAKGSKDDTVKTTIYLGGQVELCGFDMRLKYDKDVLEFISMNSALSLDVVANHDATNNLIKFNYSSIKNRTKSAKVIEVEFKIKNTTETETTLTLMPIEIIKTDATQDNIPVPAEYNLENGVITIE